MKGTIIISLLILTTVKVNGQIKSSENMQSERFITGWEKLKEIDGEAGEKV